MLSWLGRVVDLPITELCQSCDHAGTVAYDDLYSWAYQWGALQPHGHLSLCHGKIAGQLLFVSDVYKAEKLACNIGRLRSGCCHMHIALKFMCPLLVVLLGGCPSWGCIRHACAIGRKEAQKNVNEVLDLLCRA